LDDIFGRFRTFKKFHLVGKAVSFFYAFDAVFNRAICIAMNAITKLNLSRQFKVSVAFRPYILPISESKEPLTFRMLYE